MPIKVRSSQIETYEPVSGEAPHLIGAQADQDRNYRALAINLGWSGARRAVRLVTTTSLPACTYTAGTVAGYPGIGASLTASANGALTVDSIVAVTGDRLLVTEEVSSANNGIYVVTEPGDVGTPGNLRGQMISMNHTTLLAEG